MELWAALPQRVRLIGVAGAATLVLTSLPAPQSALARELALAQGTIAISEAPSGLRAPSCGELFVEARDALDNHLIAQTKPETDADGACRYALSVPAQSAVWLHARPALVAAARATPDGGSGVGAPPSTHRIQGRGVQIRFTVIAPATYFFAPGEQKTVPLSY
ncbi:MAG: hypothetical protein QOJ39_3387 [Candidatus Eremiobacteraeota bacterium]|jgi:hypothetical protein|nr:hypothetical protein [Candidatus Eremiobacteraeota bacterium]